ncbi:ParA family protein [Vogesella sp. XCS3]|uniref:ParA family protein n=1 Tax=Vogesella sp. XCS3 TaxID=2877939 RepID=UPI001B49B1B7|nr:ParA family protein [Vogesella sp. XCS3]MBP7581171.1 ParA family protein [Vogesella sp.]UDM17977.1 ParA family protein [Vogesella sp. XCS3]
MAYSILVANPKGGSGKSTLSTNLAGFYAAQGTRIMLGDVDRQQSSLAWLACRDEALPPIDGWKVVAGEPARPPKGTQVIVLDSPAGLHGKKLAALVAKVDRVIVPIQPSPFDMWASRDFFEVLLQEKAVRKQKAFVGVVGMRIDSRTKSARDLQQFLDGLGVPVIGYLRNTQLYVQAVAMGQTLFDLPPARASKEREAWQSIIDWLDN